MEKVMTKDEALKMAIETLEYLIRKGEPELIRTLLVCKEAVSQPESQPESVVLNNKTTQKPLSDEEITKMANTWGNGYQPVIIDFARAIEKSHGIGE
jgi:hypothetical protein